MKRKIHCIMNRKSNLVISQNFPKLTSNNKIVKGNSISELFFQIAPFNFKLLHINLPIKITGIITHYTQSALE